MNPRPTVEQCDVGQEGCVEIKNLDGKCVLMSAEAFRAMKGVRIDRDGADHEESAPHCKHDCQRCIASLSCGQSRKIKHSH